MTDLPVAIIVAMDRRRVIGKDGRMPWHLPEELQWFKTHTIGNPILMGRKTFESLPAPLPGRQNIVLSRDPDYSVPQGVWLFRSSRDAERAANALFKQQNPSEDIVTSGAGIPKLFIIGGVELFRYYLPRAAYLYLSEIDAEYEGDTYFPEFDPQSWRAIHDESGISQTGIGIRYRILTKPLCN